MTTVARIKLKTSVSVYGGDTLDLVLFRMFLCRVWFWIIFIRNIYICDIVCIFRWNKNSFFLIYELKYLFCFFFVRNYSIIYFAESMEMTILLFVYSI